jgi:Protein of unknown function (DUF3102)
MSELVTKKDEAAEIGKLVKAGKDSLVKAGKRLAAMKAKLKHGEWLPWLEKNKKKLGIGENPERAAQRLMALAENPTLTSELMWGNKKALPAPSSPPSGNSNDSNRIGSYEAAGSSGAGDKRSESNGSDLPDDADDDEKEIHWAQQMCLRIDEDLRCADIDRTRGLVELLKILAKEVGRPEVTEGRKLPDAAQAAAVKRQRGRPKGAKNKPKVATAPTPAPAAAGNIGDAESEAQAMRDKFAALDDTQAAPPASAEPAAEDDLDITKQPFYRGPSQEAAA